MATIRIGSTDVSEEDLIRYCWATGNFLEERLDALQLELTELYARMKPRTRAFILESRKIGKTYGFLAHADSTGRKLAEAIIRMAYPTKLQGKSIIVPLMNEIQDGCPAEFRWKNNEDEGCWILPHNKSRLYLAGTDDADQIDRLRGPKADLLLIDEITTFKPDNLKYLVNSVLWPQTLNTGGLTLMSGTAPVSLDHPSVDFIRQAKLNGTLIVRTIHDNPRLSRDTIREICRLANESFSEEEIELILEGKLEGSPEWEREFMCRLIADKDARVTPEFNELLHVQKIFQGPPAFKFVFLDHGHVKHFFAAVFCTINFSDQTLEVHAEYASRRKSTSEIKEHLQKIETELGWDDQVVTRWMDQTAAQQIYDFNQMKYHVSAAMRSPGKGQVVVDLRNLLRANRVIVDPRCKRLIMTLNEGIWSSKLKEDFHTSPALGHLDLVDALAQGCMMLRQTGKWQSNPYTTRGTTPGYVPGVAREKTVLDKNKNLGYSIMRALGAPGLRRGGLGGRRR